MKTILSALIIIVLIISCSTQTKVTGIWTDEEYKVEDFKKIAVVAITSNIKNRDIFENAIVKKLQEIGYNAVPGAVIITPQMMKLKDKEVLKKALLRESIDGVVAISLLDIKESTHYVQGSGSYYPHAYGSYYGSFYDYYDYNYNRVYSAGYYQTSTQIFLESNFYSLTNDKLIQTVQSETFNPADVADLARSYSGTLVQQLVVGRILKNKALIEKRDKK